MSSSPKDAGYILGYSAEEHARLDIQAASSEPATRRVLEKVGVKSGWHCLDVACGTASVTRILGGLVGPKGAVHAVDLDETYGIPAISKLKDAGPDNYSFEKLDVTGDTPPKGAPFDLVFTRLLIVHMAEPVKVLRNLWNWVRPGGVLLVQDFDMHVAVTMTDGGRSAEAEPLIWKIFAAMGKDYRAGTSMPRRFLQAGIGAHDGIEVSASFGSGKDYNTEAAPVLKSLIPVAVKYGVATAAEIEAVIAAMAKEAEEPYSIGRWPDMIATWKRKPL